MAEHDLPELDPIALFSAWMDEAERSEPNDPNAVALATATAAGAPSVRMVLLKRHDPHGFCFFTNSGSEKGEQLQDNPQAAMCFHWKSLRRQIRIEGLITDLPDRDVDEYFHSRSRRSQLGAAVSDQSRPLDSRETLERRVQVFSEQHPGEVPRPAYWRGYCLTPARIEFWMDGPDRLHDRFLYTRTADAWTRQRLYP